MKIRSGFVSNSSSSSFVVAVDGNNTSTKITLSFEIDLEAYASKKVSTEEELMDYMREEYCFDPDSEEPYEMELYEKSLEQIKNGKTVLFGYFSDEGTTGEEKMLCYEGLRGKVDEKKIVIIESEGGY